jgi:hypothetical protein
MDEDGIWHLEMLLADAQRLGTKSAAQWNNLKIIARGSQLWFIANGAVVGTAIHDARSVGDVAIAVTAWDDDQNGEFQFRNLIVRQIK